jgi:aryl-alcohol dehydrogenase-like predicted oxidoreductase
MHYRTLGNSGAVVSTFALGTMTFGAEADVYSKGASEEIIGRWLAAHPTDSEQV